MNLRAWQHMTISAALALVALGLLFFILVWPALSGRAALHARTEALAFHKQKFSLAAEQVPGLEKELESLAGVEVNQEGFLQEKPRALAAADLQQLLGALTEQTGGALISTQVLQERDNERTFPGVTVKVFLRGATGSLLKLMHRLETNQPLLLLDNLLVQKRRRAGDSSRRDVDELDIRFDVSAFIYQSEAP